MKCPFSKDFFIKETPDDSLCLHWSNLVYIVKSLFTIVVDSGSKVCAVAYAYSRCNGDISIQHPLRHLRTDKNGAKRNDEVCHKAALNKKSKHRRF